MDEYLYQIITNNELANQIANSTFLPVNTVKGKCLNMLVKNNKINRNIGDILLSKELKKLRS